jgi:hypothetical protein
MSNLRSVNTYFWRDSFTKKLNASEKCVFLYLLTNDAVTLGGCYEISIDRIAFETKISELTIKNALEKFEKAEKILFKDDWIVLLNYHKHQKLNKNMGVAAAKALNSAPLWVREAFDKWFASFGTLPEWFGMVRLNRSRSKEVEAEEPQTNGSERPKPQKPYQPPKKRQDEINTWLDGVAGVVGAKSRQTMAGLPRWRDVVDRAVTEQRDVVKFLDVVRSEKDRNKDTPQFFSPESCLKILQSTVEISTNGNGKKPEWKVAIENCNKCDENGYIISDDGATVCKHK